MDAGESTTKTTLARKGQNQGQTPSFSIPKPMSFPLLSRISEQAGWERKLQLLAFAVHADDSVMLIRHLSGMCSLCLCIQGSTVVGNWERHSQHSLPRGWKKLLSCWPGLCVGLDCIETGGMWWACVVLNPSAWSLVHPWLFSVVSEQRYIPWRTYLLLPWDQIQTS